MNVISRLDEDCATLIQQGEDLKREIQTFVDNLIAVIEANKKNTFAEVEKETNKSIYLNFLSLKIQKMCDPTQVTIFKWQPH